MKNRLSIREMFALDGVEADYDSPFPSHLALDSRDVQVGGAFVALEGERTDGHLYIPQAQERGAALIIGRKGKCPRPHSVPCVELEEPERDLGRLAARYVEHVAPRELIAVTGSVGKTTTREAIHHLLEGHFEVHSAVRSFNTIVGCSSTVLAMPLGTEVLLLEFGANSMGEIRNLTRLFPPTTALITQVAPVHLAGFGSLTGVLQAKMEIAESSRLKNFVYDADSPLLRESVSQLSPSVNALGVGLENGAYRIKRTVFQMENRMPVLAFDLAVDVGLKNRQESCSFKAGVWGEKLAMPLAMAVAVGDALGISLKDCASALRSFVGLKGRGCILPLSGSGRFIVDDAYNANPISMRSSLETFLSLKTQGKKFAVLGDMRELGENEVQYHKDLLSLVEKLDRAVFVGNLWKKALKTSEKWTFVGTWQDAVEALEKNSCWEALLVKGSNSFRLQDLVKWAEGKYSTEGVC